MKTEMSTRMQLNKLSKHQTYVHYYIHRYMYMDMCMSITEDSELLYSQTIVHSRYCHGERTDQEMIPVKKVKKNRGGHTQEYLTSYISKGV